MKKILFVLIIGVLTFANCTGVRTMSSGLENESFLEFVGNPRNYSGGVDVVIDDAKTFKAEVKKENANRLKGNIYAISTGTHTVVVSYNGNVIYQKQVFVSSQETKKIVLP